MKLPALAAALATVSSLIACGSESAPPAAPVAAPAVPETPVTTPDKEIPKAEPMPPPGPDHGKPSATYPAFTPEMGQLVNNGGFVMTAPVLVTVTWPDEKLANKFETFGDMIGGSQYWKDIVSEYGVGPASSGPENHIRQTTEAPASISSDELDLLVADLASEKGRPTSLWPKPTDQTIYLLYLPLGTALDLGGGSDACSIGVGGYHTSTQVDGQEVAYAIMPQCGSGDAQDTTLTASHEISEAAVDPHPGADPGWTGMDDNHLAFEFFNQMQTENGDMCEFFKEAFFQSAASDLPFAVQRQWSNKSGAAGHSPCVPVAPFAFFNVTPLAVEDVRVDLTSFGGSSKQKTKGFHVALGETKTVALGFYSDAEADAWEITAVEGSPFQKPSKNPRLELTLDKTSGQNGEMAYLTAKVNVASKSKGQLVTIISSNGSSKHYMPIMIGCL